MSKLTIITLVIWQVVSLLLILKHHHSISTDVANAKSKAAFKRGESSMYNTISRKTSIPKEIPRPIIDKGDMFGASLGADASAIFFFYPALFLFFATWVILILHLLPTSEN